MALLLFCMSCQQDKGRPAATPVTSADNSYIHAYSSIILIKCFS